MRSSLSSLRQFIARGRIDDAITAVGSFELDREQRRLLLTLQTRSKKLEQQQRRGVIASQEEAIESNRIVTSFLSLLDEIEDQGTDARPIAIADPEGPEPPLVFISYANEDRPLMLKVRRALAERAVRVRTDLDDLAAGVPLQESLLQVLRETGVVLCLVSERSLLSDWVAFEILKTLAAEEWTGRRRLIAGYLDERFLDPAFRLEATDSIDRRLAELDRLAAEYRSRQLDLRDIERRRDRLIQLRQGLGSILERLRESLTVDLRDPAFGASVERIVSALATDSRGGRL